MEYNYYYSKNDLIMTCQNIKNNFQENKESIILVCFYSTKSGKQLTATSFNIENNFQLINSTDFFSNSLIFLEIISSSLFNHSKIIIHSNRYMKDKKGYLYYTDTSFFIYENQNNNLKLFHTIRECRSIKNNFFYIIDKYILICYTDSSYPGYTNYKNINIFNFSKEFFQSPDNKIENQIISISECIYMNSFSIIYNHYSNKYDLISDCPNEDNIFFLSNNTEKIEFKNSSITIPSENSISNCYFSETLDLIKNLNITKDEILNELPEIINKIEIGKEYTINGEDFILVIKPTNTSYYGNTTYVNLSQCENILRNSSNISLSSILTILQIEIKNNNEKSLTNKLEYEVIDDKKNILNLSKCNSNIQILFSLNNNSLDLNSISDFQNSGIDIFNINDSFFNDICYPHSNSENDVILKDRIKDIYQNYSLCDEGCNYNAFIIENNSISCDCKIKTDIDLNESIVSLPSFSDIKTDSNFDIIKCYNLVFSSKGKSNNIGFWIFLFLIIILIILLILHFYKGIKPIKDYIFQEMKKYGYIDDDKDKKIQINNINKNKIKNEKKRKEKNKKDKRGKKYNLKSPPKKNKLELIDNSSTKDIKQSERGVLNQFNSNDIRNGNKKEDINNNIEVESDQIVNKKKDKNKIKKKKDNKDEKGNKILINNLILLGKSKRKVDSIPTQSIDNIENIDKKGIKEKNKKEEEINEKVNNTFSFNLININLNNIKEYTPNNSLHILNNYTFEEAIKYDMRSICAIFYIFLLSKQAIFHAFLYRSPLELFPLRFCLLIFIMSSDLALNAFFYFDDKISEKYKYTKSLFLFTFSSNITIILLSTLVGFIFMTLFTNLGNSINKIKDIFKNEEQKILNDKKYVVSEQRKKEIIDEVNKILKVHHIKVIILISIESLFMLFFWYYVTAFCHVYSRTQKSWLLDSFLSILSRLVIELLFSLAFAKLYRLSVESNIHCIYKFVLFFYCFA